MTSKCKQIDSCMRMAYPWLECGTHASYETVWKELIATCTLTLNVNYKKPSNLLNEPPAQQWNSISHPNHFTTPNQIYRRKYHVHNLKPHQVKPLSLALEMISTAAYSHTPSIQIPPTNLDSPRSSAIQQHQPHTTNSQIIPT